MTCFILLARRGACVLCIRAVQALICIDATLYHFARISLQRVDSDEPKKLYGVTPRTRDVMSIYEPIGAPDLVPSRENSYFSDPGTGNKSTMGSVYGQANTVDNVVHSHTKRHSADFSATKGANFDSTAPIMKYTVEQVYVPTTVCCIPLFVHDPCLLATLRTNNPSCSRPKWLAAAEVERVYSTLWGGSIGFLRG